MHWQNIFYNNKKSLIGAALLLSTLISCWLVFQTLLYQPRLKTEDEHQSDAFMEEVHAVDFNELGKIEAEFFSKKMLHYPIKNITEMDMPRFIIHVQGRAPWEITAFKGRAYEGIKRIALWDQVNGYEPKSANNLETTIETESIMVFPSAKYAETNQEITAKQPGVKVKSRGAQVDLNKHTIKLLANVRGEYVPAH